MILKFGHDYNEQDKLEIIGEPKTIKEAFSMISKEMNKRKIKNFYIRSCLTPDYLLVDYGSWSKFFYIDDLPTDIKKQWDSYTEGSTVV